MDFAEASLVTQQLFRAEEVGLRDELIAISEERITLIDELRAAREELEAIDGAIEGTAAVMTAIDQGFNSSEVVQMHGGEEEMERQLGSRVMKLFKEEK